MVQHRWPYQQHYQLRLFNLASKVREMWMVFGHIQLYILINHLVIVSCFITQITKSNLWYPLVHAHNNFIETSSFHLSFCFYQIISKSSAVHLIKYSKNWLEIWFDSFENVCFFCYFGIQFVETVRLSCEIQFWHGLSIGTMVMSKNSF